MRVRQAIRTERTHHQTGLSKKWRCVALCVLFALFAASCSGSDSETESVIASAAVAADDAAPDAETASAAAPATEVADDEPESETAVGTTSVKVEAQDSDSDSDSDSDPDTEVVEDSETATLIEFSSCGGVGLSECAMVDVPLDYGSPDGETVQIHVTRVAATGERVGSLFLNPGGPGGSLEQMVKGMGQGGPPPIVEQFDLIGIDPRGTGKSGLVDCNSNWLEDTETVLTPEDGFEDDIDRLVDDFVVMAEDCEAEHGADYLASLTTENAARDMETVRIALGGEPLNYLGYSYGTAIGSVYATLFPDSIRSMILDSAVPTDPAESDLDARAARLEATLVRLDTVCELWAACPVADVGLLNAIDQVRQELQQNGNIGPLKRFQFERAVGAMAAIGPVMPDVAQGLRLALDGDGAMLADMGQRFLSPVPGGGFAEYTAAGRAIICADGWNIIAGTEAELLGQAERTDAAYPNLGSAVEVPCDLWPVSGPGIAPVDYRGDAEILVVGNTYDPITPLEFGEALVEELGPKATLLTWDGSDHTVVLSGKSQCIDGHALAYLIDLVVPSPDTVCELRGLVGLSYDFSPVVVNRVTPGSPSEAAGVQTGDRILEYNGQEVLTAPDFGVGPPGSETVLLVDRDGEQIELTMTRGLPVWDLWRSAE